MNFAFVAGLALFIVAFGGFYAINYDFASGSVREGAAFVAPYNYIAGSFTSHLNAYFFVFVFSLLFFGYSTPIALGLEGAKHASAMLHGANPFELVFIIPSLIGAYAAIVLGQGVLEDIEGNSVFEKWNAAVKFFAIGLALTVALSIAGQFLIT
ncbi:MAG: hypothetical protein ABH863_00560 [Candidatus Micrarchaeota archaeon]